MIILLSSLAFASECGNYACEEGERETCPQDCPITCGNNIIETGEDCDDGTLNSDIAVDGCRMSCRDAYCGDGITDTGEECDEGYHDADLPNVCRDDCTLPYCGDGVLDDETEECDDGNDFDNDGCKNCVGSIDLTPSEEIDLNPIVFESNDEEIKEFQDEIINNFKRTEIPSMLTSIIGNQKANVYSVDEFVIYFETSGEYFEKVSTEEYETPTMDVIFSENSLEQINDATDESIILDLYKQGEIKVRGRGFFNKIKLSVAGFFGKFFI